MDNQGLGCACIQCVRTQNIGVAENLGQYNRLLSPGLHCLMWPITNITGYLSLRIQQIDVMCETKTKDNVFVQIGVSIQYRVLAENAYDAWYRLSDPSGQIQAYVFDVVRSTVPRMELDAAFTSKKDIAFAVLEQLTSVMKDYGYEIMESLVTDIQPDAKVVRSMNEINASKRLKEAALYKAEADKVRQVKAAEAEAEARYLSGVGVARQRKAIVQGIQTSVTEFSENIEGTTPKDVMDILLLSQYLDTISAIGANNLLLVHEPLTVTELQKQVGRSFLENSNIEQKQEATSFLEKARNSARLSQLT